jgi:hypothetical protein
MFVFLNNLVMVVSLPMYVKQTYNTKHKTDLGEVGWVMWTGLVWLRIGTGGELL